MVYCFLSAKELKTRKFSVKTPWMVSATDNKGLDELKRDLEEIVMKSSEKLDSQPNKSEPESKKAEINDTRGIKATHTTTKQTRVRPYDKKEGPKVHQYNQLAKTSKRLRQGPTIQKDKHRE